MARNTSPVPIWHKIFAGLNRAKLDYVLVGGAALAAYGIPRSTLDIDIHVPVGEDNLIKLFEIADTLGLESAQKDILKLIHRPNLLVNQWVCFSHKGQDILDVLLVDRIDFNKLYNNSKVKKDNKVKVRIASLKDIASIKKASNRAIDLADLKLIRESKRK